MNISLLKNGFWATYGAIGTRLLALLSNLLLARLLLPSEFGIISIAYIFWSFVNLFTQNTVGAFIVYKGIKDKSYLNTAYTISLCMGLVLGLGIVIISPLAANFFGVPNLVWILAIFAFNLLISSAVAVYGGVLIRQMQYRELADVNLTASLVRVFCTTGCALLGLSYWSFVLGDTACWLTTYVLIRRATKQNFRLEITKESRAEVLSYCLGATGFGLGFYANSNCDNFVIGKLLGNTNLGYYNFAYQLTMSLNTILGQAVGQLGMSVFAQLPDDKQQENALLEVVEHIAFLAAPVYALLFLVIDQQTITLVFGAKWIPASTVIHWLLVFAYFRLLNEPLSSMLYAKGRPDVNAKVNIYIAPLAVGSFIFGAGQGGIVGVSIAVALVLGIVWTISWWWIACRALGWSLMKFLIPCFKPALFVLPAFLVCLSLPVLLKQFLFISIYILCVRIIAAKQFFKYQSLIKKIQNRIAQRPSK